MPESKITELLLELRKGLPPAHLRLLSNPLDWEAAHKLGDGERDKYR